jgi:hypothetical protein
VKKALESIGKKIQAILTKLRGKKTKKMGDKPGSKLGAKSSNKAEKPEKVDSTSATDKDKKEDVDGESGSWKETTTELGTGLLLDVGVNQGISMMTRSGGDDALEASAQTLGSSSTSVGKVPPLGSSTAGKVPPLGGSTTKSPSIFQPFPPQLI